MKLRRKAAPLASVRRELREGTWLQNAQTRSTRRKSPWNLLLLLAVPVWLLLVLAGVRASREVSVIITNGHPLAGGLIWPNSIAPALVYLPLLLGTIVPAMVLVNYFVYYCVPPARRAMNAEDKAFPGTEYSMQQPVLVRISMVTVPSAFLLAVVGQLFL
jgi:hypothetical protein